MKNTAVGEEKTTLLIKGRVIHLHPNVPNMSRRIGKINLRGAQRTYSWKMAEIKIGGKKATLL